MTPRGVPRPPLRACPLPPRFCSLHVAFLPTQSPLVPFPTSIRPFLFPGSMQLRQHRIQPASECPGALSCVSRGEAELPGRPTGLRESHGRCCRCVLGLWPHTREAPRTRRADPTGPRCHTGAEALSQGLWPHFLTRCPAGGQRTGPRLCGLFHNWASNPRPSDPLCRSRPLL